MLIQAIERKLRLLKFIAVQYKTLEIFEGADERYPYALR